MNNISQISIFEYREIENLGDKENIWYLQQEYLQVSQIN